MRPDLDPESCAKWIEALGKVAPFFERLPECRETGDRLEPGPLAYGSCGDLAASSCPNLDVHDCELEKTCFESVARPTLAAPLRQCLTSAACTHTNADACVKETVAPYLGDAAFRDFTQACTRKREACAVGGQDAWCTTTMALFREPLLLELQACFALPCDAVPGCLNFTAQFECCATLPLYDVGLCRASKR